MEAFLDKVKQLSRFFNVIAGISITFIMLLTVMDVILRTFKRPIVGTYEVVAFSGALVIAFAIPLTSWFRGHIFVDFFVLKMPHKVQIRVPPCHEVRRNRAVLPDRLEHGQGGNGPPKDWRGVAYPATAFLLCGLRSGDLLLCTMCRAAV